MLSKECYGKKDLESVGQATTVLAGHLSKQQNDFNAVALLAEAFTQKATLSGQLNQLELARNLLDYLRANDEGNVHRLRAEAVYYWSQGNHEKALEFTRNYLETNPEPFGYLLSALIMSDQQDWQAAKSSLAEALRLRPKNGLLLSHLAKIYEKEREVGRNHCNLIRCH